MRCPQAYENTHPLNNMVEGMIRKQMAEDTARIAREAVDKRIRVVIAVNNRAGGNAPTIAQMVAERFSAAE